MIGHGLEQATGYGLQRTGYGVQAAGYRVHLGWGSDPEGAACGMAAPAFFIRSSCLIAARRPGARPTRQLVVGVSSRSCYTCEKRTLRGSVERFTHFHNATSAMVTHERFRRSQRLGLRADFDRILAERCAAGNDVLAVLVSRNDSGRSRLGLRVSKRVGNAVQRAYVRRRIREAFRRSQHAIPQGYDILCMARSKALDRRVDLAQALRSLVAQALRRHRECSARKV